MRRAVHIPAVVVIAVGLAAPAGATWSIVATDSRTGEVGIASVTCLESYDLRALTPVMLVGVGGAAVQAAGDFAGTRRPVIREQLLAGTPPRDILDVHLAVISGHASRQYGIADTAGRMASFTGSANGAWASGVTGNRSTMVYAIQGNVLAGECVVLDAETAFRTAPGDMPERLMAAMEAARAAGGDGRCSCAGPSPTACGCPVAGKSGDIGYLMVARAGDVDDPTCDADGCADGDYFLNLNFAFQPRANPDPVAQMRAAFDPWRAALGGRPDALHSRVEFVAVGGGDWEMQIELVDWQDLPVTSGAAVSVAHEPSSAGLSAIGVVADLGGGRYAVPLAPAPGAGVDRFRVTADDGVRPVVLMPSPELALDSCVAARAPVEGVTVVEVGAGELSFAWTAPAVAPPAFHVNAVSTKGDLEPPAPHRGPRPGGVGAAVCDSDGATPVCSSARPAASELYQVVEACGPSGDDEGPVR